MKFCKVNTGLFYYVIYFVSLIIPTYFLQHYKFKTFCNHLINAMVEVSCYSFICI